MDSAKTDTTVQHVNKKSSDELLRKFAETEDRKAAPKKVSKRRRSLQNGVVREAEDRRSLLPLAAKRKSALLRKLGIQGRAQIKAREIRNKSVLGTIEKTWLRAIEGASKVFMEKHYNRHKRLINDMV